MNIIVAIETNTNYMVMFAGLFFFTEINLETGVHRNKMAERELQEQVIKKSYFNTVRNHAI